MDIVAGNRTLPPFAAPEDVDYYVTGTDPGKRAWLKQMQGSYKGIGKCGLPRLGFADNSPTTHYCDA